MKKVASLVMSALIISTLSGCTNRNTAMRNYDNRGINQGTTQGTRTGYGTTNQATPNYYYKDGVYTGESDKGPYGYQGATVTVTGGRITSIALRTYDLQGREVGANNISTNKVTGGTGTAGTTTGTTGITGTNTGTTADTPGARTYGTPGVTTGGMAGGMAASTPSSPRGNTGYDATNNNINVQGPRGTVDGTVGGTVDGRINTPYGGTNTGTTAGGITNGTNTGTTIGGITTNGDNDTVRRQLTDAMIRQQTYNVNLGGNDTATVANYKLAVKRALDKAK